jgi:hypothetical protein
MAARQPPQASPKLLALQKDFQQIASLAGFLNSSVDPPQMRLFFTLYGRVTAETEEDAAAMIAPLQEWSEKIAVDLREGSSSAILPPKIQLSAPQQLPAGGWYIVSTMNFSTKVTDTSYLRVRTAVLIAYQRAIALREGGFNAAIPVLPEELGLPELDG